METKSRKIGNLERYRIPALITTPVIANLQNYGRSRVFETISKNYFYAVGGVIVDEETRERLRNILIRVNLQIYFYAPHLWCIDRKSYAES